MLKKLKVLFMSGLFFLMLMVMPNGALSETFNWKMTSPFPPGDTANQNSDEFAKMVEKNSNGKVKITYYGGTLGSPKDAWDMVATNTVQLIWTGDLYNPGRMPVTQLIALPFEVPDVRNAYNILMELSKAGYLKEYTDAGLKPLYFLPTYPIGLYTTKKKITKLEDFQGMKIRCGTGIQGQALIALGASTVSLPGSEEYMSLQTGVLDGTITGINIGIHRKLHEVIKYSIREPPLFFGVMVMLMNEEAWKSAPPDVQKGIEQAVQEIAPREIQAIVDQEGAMWSEFSKKVDVYSISPEEQARWRKVIGNLGEKHAEELAAKGYPAKDALVLIRKILSK